MREDLANHKGWVLVEIPNLIPHYFTSFSEALTSPIKGHLMTEKYYKYHYE